MQVFAKFHLSMYFQHHEICERMSQLDPDALSQLSVSNHIKATFVSPPG